MNWNGFHVYKNQAMKLEFKADQQIGELRKAFNTLFPRLTVRLFTEAHAVGEGSPLKEQVEDDQTLETWLNTKGSASIEVRPDMTISEFESLLESHGLHAQVFRRSGSLWLETTQSDGWTLDRANNETY